LTRQAVPHATSRSSFCAQGNVRNRGVTGRLRRCARLKPRLQQRLRRARRRQSMDLSRVGWQRIAKSSAVTVGGGPLSS